MRRWQTGNQRNDRAEKRMGWGERTHRFMAVFGLLSLCLFCTGVSAAEPVKEKEEEVSGERETNGGGADEDGAGISEADGAEDEILIRMVGDDLIHQPIFQQSLQGDGTYQFDPIFAPMREVLQAADVAILNQETIFVKDNSQVSSYPLFGSPDELGHAIAGAGFDVVAHATNHTMDKGVTGILETIEFWETNYPDMVYLGIHKDGEDSDVRYLTVKGVSLAFVNYTYGLNGLESRRRGREYLVDLLSDFGIEGVMQAARENSDVQIAILHAGNEYVHTPTACQRQQIHRFLDLGADIVFCAHPHVVQPCEMVTTANGSRGLVYYSLGNYISAQYDVSCILGGMAEVRLRRDENGAAAVASYDLIPLITHQQGGNYTTYLLSEYPEELAQHHEVLGKLGGSTQAVWELFGTLHQHCNQNSSFSSSNTEGMQIK